MADRTFKTGDLIKVVVLLSALAGTLLCQEFTVSTPKGNLVVNVKSNSLELGSSFKMQGTITNTTDWNFKYLRLTVKFSGPNGSEWAALCPTDGYSCETLGISVPAHRTIDFDTGPGVHFSMEPMNYSGENPPVKGYGLSLKEALYDIQYRFTMLKPMPSDALTFEDSSLAFKFLIDPGGIGCSIRNNTADPISINWNVVSYVDASGDAHKVIHSGIRLVDKEATQSPTLIPPTARINETLFPTDLIKSGSQGLFQEPLWPSTGHVSKDQSGLKALEGSTFSVFMPIETAGKTTNYSFVFKIVSVMY